MHEEWNGLVNFLHDIVREKAALDPTQHHDIISQMIHASDSEGKLLSLEEIVGNVIIFFFGRTRNKYNDYQLSHLRIVSTSRHSRKDFPRNPKQNWKQKSKF